MVDVVAAYVSDVGPLPPVHPHPPLDPVLGGPTGLHTYVPSSPDNRRETGVGSPQDTDRPGWRVACFPPVVHGPPKVVDEGDTVADVGPAPSLVVDGPTAVDQEWVGLHGRSTPVRRVCGRTWTGVSGGVSRGSDCERGSGPASMRHDNP